MSEGGEIKVINEWLKNTSKDNFTIQQVYYELSKINSKITRSDILNYFENLMDNNKMKFDKNGTWKKMVI